MMKVLLVSPEIAPFAKTGGLADVSGALPKALKRLGCNVNVFMPRYKLVDKKKFNLKKVSQNGSISVPISNRLVKAEVFSTSIEDRTPVYFIEQEHYYNRPNLYGDEKGDYSDNAERFIFFSRSVLEVCKHLNIKPDIIHCNDWQTALIPVYLKTIYKDDPFYKDTKTVITVHNIGYQGVFWAIDMHLTNLGWDIFTPEGIEYYGNINILKGGLMFSDLITTVSDTYSKEIQTKEYGYGLEGVLQKRSEDIYGIVNGVDYDIWNPENDPFIKKDFSLKRLDGKVDCKKDLLKIFGIKHDKKIPLIGIISRLVDHKGFDLIAEAIDKIMDMEIQMVILGTGDKKYHILLEKIAKKFPKKVGIKLGFDNELAHKIEAGSDMFLMPSKYEPCGLNQLYSFKYGTIPLVRATGGLNDTVKDFNPKTGKGNGFKFKEYKAEKLLQTIKEALAIYRNEALWQKIMKNAMSLDYSWDASAKEYISLYRKVLLPKGKEEAFRPLQKG